ncbi:ABC transporter permease [Kineosporia mesophila]|uniref:ABC transporter permease n=1 Tax=Kineosporia mesophila TaxID=566012 RepID=A0ABP6ZUN4_9ACTN|nr:ABC transporter permease [Kineosporia mesophila]MCD5349753.1 ABC transporter permease [Kineosporia mesophila]
MTVATATPGRRWFRLAGPRRGGAGQLELWCLYLIVALTVILPFAHWLVPSGETEIVGTPFTAPGAQHWLGTDEQGRDVLSRVILGLASSWWGVLGIIVCSLLIGTIIGTIAGTLGGWVDAVLMRLTDAVLALPGPLVSLLVVAALGPGLRNVLLAVTATWWPWYARIVRSEVRAVRVLPHVDAARSAGMSPLRVALRHVLPGVLRPIVVVASLDVGSVLLLLASLSFIGLGAPAPAAEIGSMSAAGFTYLFSAPWVALAPAAVLFTVTMAANFAGDGVQERIG